MAEENRERLNLLPMLKIVNAVEIIHILMKGGHF
jgi:hypothetical protein